MKKNTGNNGVKIGATAIIWAFATGMMAICIPLVSISKSGIILPVAVIAGVTISTVSIWGSANKKVIDSSENLRQIEQRVRDLETIVSSDKLDSTNKYQEPSSS